MVNIGKITKTQGLKGDVRAKVEFNNHKIFEASMTVTVDSTEYELEKFSDRKTFIVLKLKGVDFIDESEKLVGKTLYVSQSNYQLSDASSVSSDIMGYEVQDEESLVLGKVSDINNYGAGEVVEVEQEGKTFMFPNINNVIVSVDHSQKTVVLNQSVLQEIVVYN